MFFIRKTVECGSHIIIKRKNVFYLSEKKFHGRIT